MRYGPSTRITVSVAAKTVLAQNTQSILACFASRMCVDENFVLSGIHPPYFAANLVFMCVNMQHAPF